MSAVPNRPAKIENAIIGRRSAPRLRLSLPARLTTMYDTRRCILIDLSRTGAQIALKEPLRTGESAILELTGIDQFGTVVRGGANAMGGINGLHFDNPLTEADVLGVRQYSEAFEAEEARALRNEVRDWVSGGA